MNNIETLNTECARVTKINGRNSITVLVDNFMEKFSAMIINGKIVSKKSMIKQPSAPVATKEEIKAHEKFLRETQLVVYTPTYTSWYIAQANGKV
jgi:hypothetical protein